MKNLFRLLIISLLASIVSLLSPSLSFADKECAISGSGSPVEICVGNTIYGGGGSSGGGSLLFGIRAMIARVF